MTWKIITEDNIEYVFACKPTDLPENNGKVRSVHWLGKKKAPRTVGRVPKAVEELGLIFSLSM